MGESLISIGSFCGQSKPVTAGQSWQRGYWETGRANHCCVEMFPNIDGVLYTDQGCFHCHTQTRYASHYGGKPLEFIGSFCSQSGKTIMTKGELGGKKSQPLLWRCFQTFLGCFAHIMVASIAMHQPVMHHTMEVNPWNLLAHFADKVARQSWQRGLW